MQSFNIIKQTQKKKSFKTEKVIGMFDLKDEHLIQRFQGEIDLDSEWNIGVIVGRSGSGKTTIAKEVFKDIFDTTFGENAIIDEIEGTVDDITKTFVNVGFSSPPSWLKPYSVLSNGEKMRVQLCKALLSNKETIVFDEFTSVVDRDVAKVVSMVVQKNIRKENKKFVAVTCHYDVIEFLEPDWVFNCDEMIFYKFKKKDDQNYRLTYTKERQNSGKLLGSIII